MAGAGRALIIIIIVEQMKEEIRLCDGKMGCQKEEERFSFWGLTVAVFSLFMWLNMNEMVDNQFGVSKTETVANAITQAKTEMRNVGLVEAGYIHGGHVGGLGNTGHPFSRNHEVEVKVMK